MKKIIFALILVASFSLAADEYNPHSYGAPTLYYSYEGALERRHEVAQRQERELMEESDRLQQESIELQEENNRLQEESNYQQQLNAIE